MLSKNIVKIEIDTDVVAIYNSLVGNPVFLSPKELESVLDEKVSPEIRRVLIKKGIYVNKETDDSKRIEVIRETYSKRKGCIDYVIVMLTNECNLACDYCIEKKYLAPKYMSESIIDSFFDLVQRGLIFLDSSVEFILYGGEPLLNEKGLCYFLEKKKVLPNSKCTIVTNGILLDNAKIELLKEANVKVSISIDGPKEITDAHRRFRNSNQSVFHKVQETFYKLKESNIKYGLSITITPELINQKELFYSWLNEMRPNAVTFNLLKLTFDSHETDKIIDYYKHASEFLIEAHEKLMLMGIFVINIRRLIKFFANHQPVFADCASVSLNQITLNSDGNIYCCQCHLEESFLFGNVKNLDVFTAPRNCLHLFENLPIFKEKCLHCSALPVCGGGCLVQGNLIFQNNDYIDEGYCEHSKKIMKWIMKRIYLSSKNDIALEI